MLKLKPTYQLFVMSFLTIYLEIAFIRYHSAHIRLIAYFTNITLISAFLGLSLGFIVTKKKVNLGYLSVFLVLVNILVSLVFSPFRPHGMFSEAIFFTFYDSWFFALKNLILIFVFLSVVGLFLALGQFLGRRFNELPRLRAYSINLSGALLGGLAFGAFSYLNWGPVAWFSVAFVLLLLLLPRKHLAIHLGLALIALAVVFYQEQGRVYWSPYNRLQVLDLPLNRDPAYPNGYAILINKYLYQHAVGLDVDPASIEEKDTYSYQFYEKHFKIYHLPFELFPQAREVLIVGAGTGNDVAAALDHPVRSVDAVEIDPTLVSIGNAYHPQKPLQDERVQAITTDARQHFRRTKDQYDLVIFGFLDSQSLYSGFSNIRLDAYVYTRDSFHEAAGLLRPGGALVVSFIANRPWVSQRLFRMLTEVFGDNVSVYRPANETGDTGLYVFACAPGTAAPTLDDGYFVRSSMQADGVSVATDDWPFLYLQKRFVPVEYVIALILLTVVAVVLIRSLVPLKDLANSRAWHFFFLGCGFMILETRAITQLSLFFGATWITSLLMISAILAMLWLANLVVMKTTRLGYRLLFLLLALSIGLTAVSYVFAHERDDGLRYLVLLVFYSVPFFLAGLIFPRSFRDSEHPEKDLAWNSLGAFVGGISEYTGMMVGFNLLWLLALGYYLMAWIMIARARKGLPGDPGPAAGSA